MNKKSTVNFSNEEISPEYKQPLTKDQFCLCCFSSTNLQYDAASRILCEHQPTEVTSFGAYQTLFSWSDGLVNTLERFYICGMCEQNLEDYYVFFLACRDSYKKFIELSSRRKKVTDFSETEKAAPSKTMDLEVDQQVLKIIEESKEGSSQIKIKEEVEDENSLPLIVQIKEEPEEEILQTIVKSEPDDSQSFAGPSSITQTNPKSQVFRCPFCMSNFKTFDLLNLHRLELHSEIKYPACNSCQATDTYDNCQTSFKIFWMKLNLIAETQCPFDSDVPSSDQLDDATLQLFESLNWENKSVTADDEEVYFELMEVTEDEAAGDVVIKNEPLWDSGSNDVSQLEGFVKIEDAEDVSSVKRIKLSP